MYMCIKCICRELQNEGPTVVNPGPAKVVRPSLGHTYRETRGKYFVLRTIYQWYVRLVKDTVARSLL